MGKPWVARKRAGVARLPSGARFCGRQKKQWKEQLDQAFERAAQEEYLYETELRKTDIGQAYLAMKPSFGRGAYLDVARDSVRWGPSSGC